MKGDLNGALTEIMPVRAVEPEFRRTTITGYTSQIAVDGPDSGGSNDLNLFDELLNARLSLRRTAAFKNVVDVVGQRVEFVLGRHSGCPVEQLSQLVAAGLTVLSGIPCTKEIRISARSVTHPARFTANRR